MSIEIWLNGDILTYLYDKPLTKTKYLQTNNQLKVNVNNLITSFVILKHSYGVLLLSLYLEKTAMQLESLPTSFAKLPLLYIIHCSFLVIVC